MVSTNFGASSTYRIFSFQKKSKYQVLVIFQKLHGAAHWKPTIHIYCLKKFQKIKKIIAFIVACPKMQKKNIFDSLEL
jgi:hypothetical protein